RRALAVQRGSRDAHARGEDVAPPSQSVRRGPREPRRSRQLGAGETPGAARRRQAEHTGGTARDIAAALDGVSATGTGGGDRIRLAGCVRSSREGKRGDG